MTSRPRETEAEMGQETELQPHFDRSMDLSNSPVVAIGTPQNTASSGTAYPQPPHGHSKLTDSSEKATKPLNASRRSACTSGPRFTRLELSPRGHFTVWKTCGEASTQTLHNSSRSVDCLNVIHPHESLLSAAMDKRSQLAIHSRLIHRQRRFSNSFASNVSSSKRVTYGYSHLTCPQFRGPLIMINNLIKSGEEKNNPQPCSARFNETSTLKQSA